MTKLAGLQRVNNSLKENLGFVCKCKCFVHCIFFKEGKASLKFLVCFHNIFWIVLASISNNNICKGDIWLSF